MLWRLWERRKLMWVFTSKTNLTCQLVHNNTCRNTLLCSDSDYEIHALLCTALCFIHLNLPLLILSQSLLCVAGCQAAPSQIADFIFDWLPRAPCGFIAFCSLSRNGIHVLEILCNSIHLPVMRTKYYKMLNFSIVSSLLCVMTWSSI